MCVAGDFSLLLTKYILALKMLCRRFFHAMFHILIKVCILFLDMELFNLIWSIVAVATVAAAAPTSRNTEEIKSVGCDKNDYKCLLGMLISIKIHLFSK